MKSLQFTPCNDNMDQTEGRLVSVLIKNFSIDGILTSLQGDHEVNA